MRPVAYLAFALLVLATGCSSLETLDRGRLNHPAMSFDRDRTPPRASYLAPLNGLQGLASGGGCSVCAH